MPFLLVTGIGSVLPLDVSAQVLANDAVVTGSRTGDDTASATSMIDRDTIDRPGGLFRAPIRSKYQYTIISPK